MACNKLLSKSTHMDVFSDEDRLMEIYLMEKLTHVTFSLIC